MSATDRLNYLNHRAEKMRNFFLLLSSEIIQVHYCREKWDYQDERVVFIQKEFYVCYLIYILYIS